MPGRPSPRTSKVHATRALEAVVTMRRMTAAGFLSLPADYRLGTPNANPRALTMNPRTGGTELWPVEIVSEEWHRLYVEVDPRDGSVWEIERLDGGGEYRILRNLTEVSPRQWHWDSIRSHSATLPGACAPTWTSHGSSRTLCRSWSITAPTPARSGRRLSAPTARHWRTPRSSSR
jgi:hypothetical protein